MNKRKTTSTAQPTTPPQLLRIPEVAKLLSCGRTKVYDLINTDGLPVVFLGSERRVSADSLSDWIKQREHRSA